MAKLLFKIFVLLHLLSIILNILANVEQSLGQKVTWLNNNSIGATNNIERYIAGWYWGATILSSVGFGDINPASKLSII